MTLQKSNLKILFSSLGLLYLLSLSCIGLLDFPWIAHRIQLPEIIFVIATPFLIQYWRKHPHNFTLFDKWTLGWIGIMVLTVLLNWDKKAAFELWGIVYLFLVTFLFRASEGGQERLIRAIQYLGVIAASLGILGWILAYVGVPTMLSWPRTVYYPYLGHVGRAMGLTGHPNMLMSILSFCILLSFASLLFQSNRRPWRYWSLVIMFLGVLLTFSKALALLVIGLLFLLGYLDQLKRKWTWLKNGLIVGLFLFYLLVTNVMVVNLEQVNWDDLQSRAYTLDHPFYSHGNIGWVWTSYAVNKWTAFSAFLAHPLLGIGPGQYNQYVEGLKAKGSYPTYFPNYDPHSTYFGLLAETGILGMLSFLLVLGALYQMWRRMTVETDLEKGIQLGLAAIFIFFLLEGVNTDNLHFRHYWVGVGVMLSMWDAR